MGGNWYAAFIIIAVAKSNFIRGMANHPQRLESMVHRAPTIK